MRLITIALILYALFSSEIALAGPQSPCYMSTNIVKCFKPIDEGSGGTGAVLTAVNGGLVYSDADSLEITSAGTASQWVLSGGAAAPTMSNTTTTGKTIDGSADEVQLTVQANATQTSAILTLEDSSANDLMTVTNSSILTLYKGAGTAQIAQNRANTSLTAPSVVASGNQIGDYVFRGYSGTAASYLGAASIEAYIDGTPDSGGDTTDMPGRLSFWTTPDGSDTRSERMRISNSGTVSIGTTTSTEMINVVNTTAAGQALRIDHDVSTADGIVLFTDSASTYSSSSGLLRVHQDSNSATGNAAVIRQDGTGDILRLEDGSSSLVTVDNDGSVSISETGGNGGNVPHNCSRLSDTATLSEVSRSCNSGEILTGGGCSGGGSPLLQSYPSDADTWVCTWTSASTSNTAYVICCDY